MKKFKLYCKTNPKAKNQTLVGEGIIKNPELLSRFFKDRSVSLEEKALFELTSLVDHNLKGDQNLSFEFNLSETNSIKVFQKIKRDIETIQIGTTLEMDLTRKL